MLRGVGIDPAIVQRVADETARKTPASQADFNKLNENQQARLAELQQVIEQLTAQIRSMQAQQQAQLAAQQAERDAMATGPNTRPTEGLAPTANAPAPSGTISAAELANLANVPIRG